jgi:hypothetical protein
MKPLFSAAFFFAAFAIFAAAALAQTTSAPVPEPPVSPGTAPSGAPPSNSAAPGPVPSSKRLACAAAASALRGQERRDQMQLCLQQARSDCLKQAIDQKIVGPQRKEFVKSCVQ